MHWHNTCYSSWNFHRPRHNLSVLILSGGYGRTLQTNFPEVQLVEASLQFFLNHLQAFGFFFALEYVLNIVLIFFFCSPATNFPTYSKNPLSQYTNCKLGERETGELLHVIDKLWSLKLKLYMCTP